MKKVAETFLDLNHVYPGIRFGEQGGPHTMTLVIVAPASSQGTKHLSSPSEQCVALFCNMR